MILSRQSVPLVAVVLIGALAAVPPAIARDEPAPPPEEQQEPVAEPQAAEAAENEQEPDQTPEPAEFEEVIVVTGTRTEGRSVTESMVPIDVLQVDDFVNQGDTDLTASYRPAERRRLLGRLSYSSDWFDAEDAQVYGAEYQDDLEVAYSFREGLNLVVGGRNVLDTVPDAHRNAGAVGNRYSQYSPFGFNGAFWYTRLQYNFSSLWR